VRLFYFVFIFLAHFFIIIFLVFKIFLLFLKKNYFFPLLFQNRSTNLAIFFVRMLGHHTGLHLYIFAVRHVNSVLN